MSSIAIFGHLQPSDPQCTIVQASRVELGFLTGYKMLVISLLSVCSPVAFLTVTLHYLTHIAIIISFPVYRHA